MMWRGQLLLETLLLALAAQGLGPEGLDPWRGWVVFKHFAREVAETPDPGVSIQVTHEDDTITMVFVRQVVVATTDWLEPAGGIVCEFTFAAGPRPPRNSEEWSFDAPSFQRFVDIVEESPSFQELVVREPIASDVYWLEA